MSPTEADHKAKFISELKKDGYQYYHIDVAAGLTGKKPFDGLIIKNGKVVAVEFKKDYRKVEPHQILSLKMFEGPAVIIRFRSKQKRIYFTWPDTGEEALVTELNYSLAAKSFSFLFGAYYRNEI